MKMNRSLIILLSCLGFSILGIFLVWRFCPSANGPETISSGNSSVVNNQSIPATAINAVSAAQKTNVTARLADEAGGFFKTVIDQQSGQYAIVNSDKTTVILKEKNGDVIWSTKIIGMIPPGWENHNSNMQALKFWGNKITYLELINNKLFVFVGPAGFSLDKKTGKATFGGSD